MRRLAIISALTLSCFSAAGTLTATVATADTSVDVVELQEKKQAATAEVLVLFASNAGTGVDKCAAHLKALTQPPLSSYDSYSCLSEKKLPLMLKTSASMATPDQGKLSLNLNRVIARPDKKPKYDVDVQVDEADGEKFVSTNVKAPAGKYFFLAGPKVEKDGVSGILVFAIKLEGA